MHKLLLIAGAVAGARARTLAPWALPPAPTGAATPRGWYLRQLELQADGLTGHLAQFWDDVMASVWVGGDADGGLHERAPYWMNGLVPLAFLLKNADGRHVRAGKTGVWQRAGFDRHAARAPGGDDALPPVDLMQQASDYVAAALAYRNASSGWMGPDDSQDTGNQYWSKFELFLALTAWADATPADAGAVDAAMRAHFGEQLRRMASVPLESWAAARWQDGLLSVEWLLDRSAAARAAAGGGDDDGALWELAELLRAQGVDWSAWFAAPTGDEHNVNLAQGLKSGAAWHRVNASDDARAGAAESRARVAHLDAAFGLPTGMFNGDELTPSDDALARAPQRGVELCGVAEAMFSYATMLAAFGDASHADRLERIAFNALPATWASPTGGDMWAHQYLQAVNEMSATRRGDDYVWTHDNGDSET